MCCELPDEIAFVVSDNQQLQLQRHLYTADTTAQLLVTTNNKRSEDGCVRGKTNGREQIKRR